MSKQHTYVLGLNTYDHDVSACLLRDGAIAFAIAKERITREKHASGFYKEVIDYCLEAEGISLDDVDLVVRNCYILPVPEMEERLIYQDMPGFLPEHEREQAKSIRVSRALRQGGVDLPPSGARLQRLCGLALRRGRGDDRRRRRQLSLGRHGDPIRQSDTATPLARESESYYRFSGTQARMPEEGLDGAGPRLSQRRVLQHAGPRRALQPRLDLHVRRLEQVRRVDGARALWPPRAGQAAAGNHDGELHVPRWTAEFNQPFIDRSGEKWESSPSMRHWEDLAWRVQDDTEKVLLARARWLRETTGAKNLCIAGGVALNCVANGRIAREGRL